MDRTIYLYFAVKGCILFMIILGVYTILTILNDPEHPLFSLVLFRIPSRSET